jgi:hypothetical protein
MLLVAEFAIFIASIPWKILSPIARCVISAFSWHCTLHPDYFCCFGVSNWKTTAILCTLWIWMACQRPFMDLLVLGLAVVMQQWMNALCDSTAAFILCHVVLICPHACVKVPKPKFPSIFLMRTPLMIKIDVFTCRCIIGLIGDGEACGYVLSIIYQWS